MSDLDPTYRLGPRHESNADFIYVASLISKLATFVDDPRYPRMHLHVTQANIELTDYGQRPPNHFIETPVADLRSGVEELYERLDALLANTSRLQDAVRIHAARDFVRDGMIDVGWPPPHVSINIS